MEYPNYLYHHGIKGMKWGVRRYQNKDGTLTDAGKKRSKNGDPFGLEKTGLSMKDRETFCATKRPFAKKQVGEDFSNPADLKKHKSWLDAVDDAYEKWYFNEDDSKTAALENAYDKLCTDHPEAKKYATCQERFIYNQASSKLKKSMDEAKASDDNLSWRMSRDRTDYEYEALYDVYMEAYNQTMYSDNIQHGDDELTHWGIKGMRWGIRRYQNKDGSLTNAGKKRRAKLESELSQLKGKKTRSKAGETKAEKEQPRKKTVSEMTDDEVRDRINRMQLEKNYYDTAKSLAQANPKKVSAGKRFLNSLGKDVLAPAAINAGKAWAENFLKEKLGLNKKSTLERLKEEYEVLDYKKKIKGAKNDMRDLDDDDLSGLKKKHDILDYQKKIEKLEKGEPSLKEIVSELNSLSSEEREALVTAAGIRYYQEGVRGKGVKPDKGKKDKKEEDDD